MALLYTFYGDDFTGSTDVLEQLAASGVRAALFLAPPTAADLERFPDLQAIGVAGDSRSRSPEWMTRHLAPVFDALREFRAPIMHYKVCSTFDSSPTHGSIGRAIELGREAFDPPYVPVIVGAHHLRRFVCEGMLFASAPDGMIHRIDRHPMSRHPVTPMLEPDLRKHLKEQTDLRIGHVSHESLTSREDVSDAVRAQVRGGARVIVFDTLEARCLGLIGEVLWQEATQRPLFCAGSSGLTMGLARAWRGMNLVAESERPVRIEATSPLLAVSGSCSEATARQIAWAASNGYRMIHADPARLLDADDGAAYAQALQQEVRAALRKGEDTVLYTSMGEERAEVAGDELGRRLGAIVRLLQDSNDVTRVVFCGGDTSSHAVQQLDIRALTWKANLQAGAPLCEAHFADARRTPLKLVLKGGQVGNESFFAIAKGV